RSSECIRLPLPPLKKIRLPPGSSAAGLRRFSALFNVGHKLPTQIPRAPANARRAQSAKRLAQPTCPGLRVSRNTPCGALRRRVTMHTHRLYGPGAEEPEPLRPVPDLRGARVEDVEGRFAGARRGSLVEEESGRFRSLDVALDDDGRHVLVPLGHARLERERGKPLVHLLGATREELKSIPPYEGGKEVDEAYGREIAQAHG